MTKSDKPKKAETKRPQEPTVSLEQRRNTFIQELGKLMEKYSVKINIQEVQQPPKYKIVVQDDPKTQPPTKE